MSESGSKGEESNDATPRSSESQQPQPSPPPEAGQEMRAVVLTSHGGLKGIRVVTRPEPTIADGEVAIRVKCW